MFTTKEVYFLRKGGEVVHTYWHRGPRETETKKFTFLFGIHQKAPIYPLYSPAIKIRWGNKIQRHFGQEFERRTEGEKSPIISFSPF